MGGKLAMFAPSVVVESSNNVQEDNPSKHFGIDTRYLLNVFYASLDPSFEMRYGDLRVLKSERPFVHIQSLSSSNKNTLDARQALLMDQEIFTIRHESTIYLF